MYAFTDGKILNYHDTHKKAFAEYEKSNSYPKGVFLIEIKNGKKTRFAGINISCDSFNNVMNHKLRKRLLEDGLTRFVV